MPSDAPTSPRSKPAVPVTLPQKHLERCRVLESRVHLLDHLPRGGTVAEVGVLGGDFSREILRVSQPRQLYLVDVFNSQDWAGSHRFDARTHEQFVRELFAAEIARNQVVLERGLSWEVMERFPDQAFDWIYVDADHGYEAVCRDLEVCQRKVRYDGYLVMNDYIMYDHLGGVEYGVIHAINEFCIREGWEILYLALQENMFNDVVLRRMR